MTVATQNAQLFNALADRVACSKETAPVRANELQYARSFSAGRWDGKLYSLSQEVQAIERALAAVKTELAEAQCGLDRVRNANTPSCRVPDRIIADVFHLGARACTSRAEEYGFLWAVSATCHHFREIALHAPFLWSNIVVRPGIRSPRTRTYLERSQAAPLRLTLMVDNTFNRWTPSRISSWVDSLASYLTRCHTLTLHTTDHDVASAILPFKVEMPDLQDFSWEGVDGVDRPVPIARSPTPLIDSKKSSPTSYSVTVRGGVFPLSWDDRVVTNLRHLTLVDVAGLPTRDVTELVSRCPTLKTLRWLYELQDDIREPLETPVFNSKSLEMVQMDLAERSDPTVLWRMDLPRLKHLSISAWSSHSRPADQASGESERFPELRTTWLSSRVFSASAAMDFLSVHPSIEEFGCGLSESTGGIISLLIEPKTVVPWTVILPNLQFIYLLAAARNPSLVPKVCTGLRNLLDVRTTGFNEYSDVKIQLNDEGWVDATIIPEEYSKLAADYPKNVILTHDEDTVPVRFRPV